MTLNVVLPGEYYKLPPLYSGGSRIFRGHSPPIRQWMKCKRGVIGRSIQWRIQDFPGGGAPTPKVGVLTIFFAENCMKTEEFETSGGASSAPPLDLPLLWDRQVCLDRQFGIDIDLYDCMQRIN